MEVLQASPRYYLCEAADSVENDTVSPLWASFVMYKRSLFFLFLSFFFFTHTLCITILTVSVTTVITVKEAIVLPRHYKVNRIRHDHTVGAPKHSTDDHWSVNGAFYSELHIILTAERWRHVVTFFFLVFALVMETDTTSACCNIRFFFFFFFVAVVPLTHLCL